MAKGKGEGVVFATVQKIGRCFFLPVSILPVAGLLLGLGASFTNETTIATYNLESVLGAGTPLYGLLSIFSQVGDIVFGNLPIIFAMAVALGMAKNEKAVAVLASGISFFVMHSAINAMLKLNGYILPNGEYSDKVLDGAIASVCGIGSLQMGVFGGIIVGLGVAALHNRFYKQELPAALSFFSGVRFVPIISVVTFTFVGILLFFLWPIIQNGIFAVGGLVRNAGYAGTFLYGVAERALIPFGLHHVFYIPFWQTGVGGTAIIDGVTVAGAQNIYFAELASPNTVKFSVDAARFLTGKFPIMMAGLPGAAFAMYRCAKPEKRKIVGGLLLSAALTSFLTGITEPLEFTFLFIAPGLFALHAAFAGLSFLLCHLLAICIGTTFSCGLIDFTLYGLLQGNAKTNWAMILPVFAAYAVAYFFVFSFFIRKFNLATPGREEGEGDIKLYTKADYNKRKGSDGSGGSGAGAAAKANEDTRSPVILRGLGGLANVVDIDACATRLRCTVRNSDDVNDAVLKSTGSKGLVKKGTGIQVIYGPQVSIVKSDLEEYVELIKSGAITEETYDANAKTVAGIEAGAAAGAGTGAGKTASAQTAGASAGSGSGVGVGAGSTAETSPAATGGSPFAGLEFVAAADGFVIPMTEVTDEGFASCGMGNGVAVRPENGIVVSPADAEVSVVMEGSNHAVGLKIAEGFEVLIHVGIDTVSLKGEGFKALVEMGQSVKKGDRLIEFDKALVEAKGLCPDVIMIFIDDEGLPPMEYMSGMNAQAGRTVIGKVQP